MKIWERVLCERLKCVTEVDENQFGFIAGRSTMGAIFVIRQLQEKYLEKKQKLYHIFVDLEKAFQIWKWVRVAGKTSDSFEIGVGVHQGSVLSPLLFILVMEEATRECRVGGLWELLYADDLSLTAETQEEVELMFGEWRRAVERRGLKVNLENRKMMVTGGEVDVVRVGRYPCGVCGQGVGANSVLCTACGKS